MTKIDYPAIRAWGAMTGSSLDYIEQQVAKAKADGAPQNATYDMGDGHWSTIDNIVNLEERPDMQRFVRIRNALEGKADADSK